MQEILSQEGAELAAFVEYLYKEAVNKHGLGAIEVTDEFVNIITGCKDPQLLLEVSGREQSIHVQTQWEEHSMCFALRLSLSPVLLPSCYRSSFT